MRRYSADDEERIGAQRMVRDWTESGLLGPAQAARATADLHVELRRTNLFLRAVLALFTGLIVAALVALIANVLDIRGERAVAVLTAAAALACFGLADYLVAAFRLYRFGVEEALALASVILTAVSSVALTSSLSLSHRVTSVVAALLGAAGGFGLYRRFGFLYAALGALACLAAAPFQLDLPEEAQRALAALAIAAVLIVVRPKRLRDRHDYGGAEYAALQAAAFAGVYLALNLQIPDGWHGAKGGFYWITYAAGWIVPSVGLAFSIRERDRELLDVSLALALVTLITNKPYLGWRRQTWDPILFGLVLMAVAVAVRRWLASGPGGERRGFTPARLGGKDRGVLSLLGTASAAIPPPHAGVRVEPDDSSFRGGRSGGGGGGGTF
jgi:hypothetical protein